jgi:hypothetical protein
MAAALSAVAFSSLASASSVGSRPAPCKLLRLSEVEKALGVGSLKESVGTRFAGDNGLTCSFVSPKASFALGAVGPPQGMTLSKFWAANVGWKVLPGLRRPALWLPAAREGMVREQGYVLVGVLQATGSSPPLEPVLSRLLGAADRRIP